VRDQLAHRHVRGDRHLHRTPAWRTGACLAIAQAADALAFAHTQGVLHRDIKPPNLILDRNGHLYVGDFGLAKALDDEPITVTGNVNGTLRYIAPEVFDGRQDGRSDLYSLGLTLFELLSLRPAFSGSTRSELIKAVIGGQVEFHQLRAADPGLPASIERIVQVACARRPEDRYRDAAEFARDLRAAAAGKPIIAVAPAAPQPSGHIGRKLVMTALLVPVLVVLGLLLVRPTPAMPRTAPSGSRSEPTRLPEAVVGLPSPAPEPPPSADPLPFPQPGELLNLPPAPVAETPKPEDMPPPDDRRPPPRDDGPPPDDRPRFDQRPDGPPGAPRFRPGQPRPGEFPPPPGRPGFDPRPPPR
jgi:serine/threonine protein kinase